MYKVLAESTPFDKVGDFVECYDHAKVKFALSFGAELQYCTPNGDWVTIPAGYPITFGMYLKYRAVLECVSDTSVNE